MTLREIRDFRRNLRRFERGVGSQLRSCCCGVTLAQCLVLLEIDEQNPLTMGQLASRLGLDTSTLSRTVDALVGKAFVERLPDDRDRRVVRIGLTSEGGGICRSIHKENDAFCRKVFEKIPPSRRGAVLRSFELLVDAYIACEGETSDRTCREPTRSGSTPRQSRSVTH